MHKLYLGTKKKKSQRKSYFRWDQIIYNNHVALTSQNCYGLTIWNRPKFAQATPTWNTDKLLGVEVIISNLYTLSLKLKNSIVLNILLINSTFSTLPGCCCQHAWVWRKLTEWEWPVVTNLTTEIVQPLKEKKAFLNEVYLIFSAY